MFERAIAPLITILLCLPSCIVPDSEPAPLPDALAKQSRRDREKDAAPKPVKRSTIGSSIEGRTIECVELGSGERPILFVASIHGDEPAGTPLCQRFVREMNAHPDRLNGYRVFVVPVANPDGLAKGTRTNARGVDLNRNFATANFKASSGHGSHGLSEPESKALSDLIDLISPECIVSIHQPLRCIDYDGPASQVAERMAASCDLPVRVLGARPGSLGSYVGVDRQIPIVTVELPKRATSWDEEELWTRYGDMLWAALL